MSDVLSIIKSITRLAKTQANLIKDDNQAYDCKILYPEWSSRKEYVLGQYANKDGVLYKCIIGHTSQADWTPEASPSLWAKVLPGQSGTETGEWIQPDSTNPYMKGDRVSHNGKTWESDIDNNVWEPGAYGWSEVV